MKEELASVPFIELEKWGKNMYLGWPCSVLLNFLATIRQLQFPVWTARNCIRLKSLEYFWTSGKVLFACGTPTLSHILLELLEGLLYIKIFYSQ